MVKRDGGLVHYVVSPIQLKCNPKRGFASALEHPLKSTRGDFVKHNFTNAILSTTRLALNVSKMFPLCFYDVLSHIQHFFAILQKYVVINFADSALVNCIACHYSKTIIHKFGFSVFILGSRRTVFEKKKKLYLPSKMAAFQF